MDPALPLISFSFFFSQIHFPFFLSFSSFLLVVFFFSSGLLHKEVPLRNVTNQITSQEVLLLFTPVYRVLPSFTEFRSFDFVFLFFWRLDFLFSKEAAVREVPVFAHLHTVRGLEDSFA